MRKGLRIALKAAAAVLGAVVVAAAVAILVLLFNKTLVRNLVQSRLSKPPGMDVHIGRLDTSLFPLRVTMDSLELVREDEFQRLSVSLARLETSGSLWKLVRGRRPALDAVTAEGLSLRLEQKKASQEPFDIETVMAQVHDALSWARSLSVSRAQLAIVMLSGRAHLKDLELSLTMNGEGGPSALVFSVGPCRLESEDGLGRYRFHGGLEASGALGLDPPYSFEATLDLASPRLTAAGDEWTVEGIAIDTVARYDARTKGLDVSRLRVEIPGLLGLEASGRGQFGGSVLAEAVFRGTLADLGHLAATAGPRLPEALSSARFTGRLEIAGKYSLHRSSLETTDSVAARLALDGVELEGAIGGTRLRARTSGWIDIAGPTRDPRLAAELNADLGPFGLSGLTAERTSVRIVATGTKDAIEVSRLAATLRRIGWRDGAGRSLAFDRGDISARARLDVGRMRLSVEPFEARMPGLPPVRGWARLGLQNGPAEARLECRNLDVASVRHLATPLLPPGLEGWELAGTTDLSAEARFPSGPAKGGRIAGRLSLSGAAFNDPAFTVAGEGLAPELAFEASWPARPRSGVSSKVPFSASLGIDAGESLWKAVFISWTRHPLRLSLNGRYDLGSGGIEDLAARFELPTIGEIEIGGSAAMGPRTSLDLKIGAHLDIAALHSLTSQADASEETRTNLAGRLGADLRLRGAGPALSAAGSVTLTEMRLERPGSKLSLSRITAKLPVLYESKPDAPLRLEEGLSPEGFLRVGELRHPLLSLDDISLRFRAATNAYALEPLSLDLYGGRLELGRTELRFDPGSGAVEGAGSLALRDIDIARVPLGSPQFKLTGLVRADFPRLDISAERIAVSGQGEAEVFGGRVVFRDLAVDRPFAEGRTISLNVDLVDLDLKKLTDEVPFGEVTGIVRGEIRDLVFSYGQPAQFTFRLESVPRRGVPQTFSLKAVDNLTVLSSGQTASAGTGQFWMRFIRGFRYEKLGIVSTLRNDTFTLNGTIHEGGVEYLVKKPPLFGISVVNREPNKVISFKEMTSRLKRVGQSGK